MWTTPRTLPPDWNQRRQAVGDRAGWQCEQWEHGARCPLRGTDCDHIDDRDNHDLSNLQLLCADHHKVKTQRQAREGRARMGTLRRPREQHPGRLH
jgi:5-methylcytosine-specific restriction protein A